MRWIQWLVGNKCGTRFRVRLLLLGMRMGMRMLVATNGQGMVDLACSRLIMRRWWWRMRRSMVVRVGMMLLLVLRHVGYRHWDPSRAGRRCLQLGSAGGRWVLGHILLINGQLRGGQIESHVGYEASTSLRGAELGITDTTVAAASMARHLGWASGLAKSWECGSCKQTRLFISTLLQTKYVGLNLQLSLDYLSLSLYKYVLLLLFVYRSK